MSKRNPLPIQGRLSRNFRRRLDHKEPAHNALILYFDEDYPKEPILAIKLARGRKTFFIWEIMALSPVENNRMFGIKTLKHRGLNRIY